jgi:hypothetical protein
MFGQRQETTRDGNFVWALLAWTPWPSRLTWESLGLALSAEAQRGEGISGKVGVGKAVVGDGAGELCFPNARVREPGLRIDLGAKTSGETGIGRSPPDLGTGAEFGLVLAPDGWPVEVEGAVPLPPD